MTLFTLADVGKRMTSDGEVEIPHDEKVAMVAEWNAREKERPTREWTQKMADSDATMTRHMEDIIDKIGTAGLPQPTIDAHAAKKALRAEKPA